MDKDFIKDGLENEKIIEIIGKVRKIIDRDSSNATIELLKKEYSFFAERYPILFDMVTRKEDFNWDYLNYFLNMRNKIIKDEITNEKASVIVGEEWFKKHVDVSKMPKEPPPTKFERRSRSKAKTDN
jgi:hypothetical protein